MTPGTPGLTLLAFILLEGIFILLEGPKSQNGVLVPGSGYIPTPRVRCGIIGSHTTRSEHGGAVIFQIKVKVLLPEGDKTTNTHYRPYLEPVS